MAGLWIKLKASYYIFVGKTIVYVGDKGIVHLGEGSEIDMAFIDNGGVLGATGTKFKMKGSEGYVLKMEG